MTLYRKLLTLTEPDNLLKFDFDDRRKLSDMMFGCEGYGQDISDEFFKDNCLSPHWSVDKQVHFISTKFERIKCPTKA